MKDKLREIDRALSKIRQKADEIRRNGESDAARIVDYVDNLRERVFGDEYGPRRDVSGWEYWEGFRR